MTDTILAERTHSAMLNHPRSIDRIALHCTVCLGDLVLHQCTLYVHARNERQRRPDVAIFELGATHDWRDAGPKQAEILGLLMAGEWRAASWAEPARLSILYRVVRFGRTTPTMAARSPAREARAMSCAAAKTLRGRAQMVAKRRFMP